MTIVSHAHKFIFLKSRKTAGSSIEGWLIPLLGRRDFVASSIENRPDIRSWKMTPHAVTRWKKPEFIAKKALRVIHPELRLEQHAEAMAVRAAVGERAWKEYYKFSVERSPWDRMISLWTWRTHFVGLTLSFDQFLDLIESDPTHPLVKDWSNLPIYADGVGKIVADRVLDFDHLGAGLREVAALLHLPIGSDVLPRHKTGHRSASQSVDQLTAGQSDRIAELCSQEIELFGWRSPLERVGAAI